MLGLAGLIAALSLTTTLVATMVLLAAFREYRRKPRDRLSSRSV